MSGVDCKLMFGETASWLNSGYEKGTSLGMRPAQNVAENGKLMPDNLQKIITKLLVLPKDIFRAFGMNLKCLDGNVMGVVKK